LTIRVGAEKKRGLESAFSSYHITRARLCMRLVLRSKSGSPFHSLKIRYIKEGQRGRLQGISLRLSTKKVTVVFLSGGFDRKELCSMV